MECQLFFWRKKKLDILELQRLVRLVVNLCCVRIAAQGREKTKSVEFAWLGFGGHQMWCLKKSPPRCQVGGPLWHWTTAAETWGISWVTNSDFAELPWYVATKLIQKIVDALLGPCRWDVKVVAVKRLCSSHPRISLAESCLASRYPEDIWTGDWTAILDSACGKVCLDWYFCIFQCFLVLANYQKTWSP